MCSNSDESSSEGILKLFSVKELRKMMVQEMSDKSILNIFKRKSLVLAFHFVHELVKKMFGKKNVFYLIQKMYNVFRLVSFIPLFKLENTLR